MTHGRGLRILAQCKRSDGTVPVLARQLNEPRSRALEAYIVHEPLWRAHCFLAMGMPLSSVQPVLRVERKRTGWC